MTRHDQILPQCVAKFDALLVGQKQMQAGIEQVRKAVCGPNGEPHDVRLAKLETRWKIFYVLAVLVTLGCAAVGTVWALTKGTP